MTPFPADMCGELQDGSQRIPLEGLEAFLHNISKVGLSLGYNAWNVSPTGLRTASEKAVSRFPPPPVCHRSVTLSGCSSARQSKKASAAWSRDAATTTTLTFTRFFFSELARPTARVVTSDSVSFQLLRGHLLALWEHFRCMDQSRTLNMPVKDLLQGPGSRDAPQCLPPRTQVPELLGEKLSFGAHLVPAAVESCRKVRVWPLAGHRAPVTAPFPRQLCSQPSVPSDLFLGWLLREPQNLVWISTFYRMRSTENGKCPCASGWTSTIETTRPAHGIIVNGSTDDDASRLMEQASSSKCYRLDRHPRPFLICFALQRTATSTTSRGSLPNVVQVYAA